MPRQGRSLQTSLQARSLAISAQSLKATPSRCGLKFLKWFPALGRQTHQQPRYTEHRFHQHTAVRRKRLPATGNITESPPPKSPPPALAQNGINSARSTIPPRNHRALESLREERWHPARRDPASAKLANWQGKAGFAQKPSPASPPADIVDWPANATKHFVDILGPFRAMLTPRWKSRQFPNENAQTTCAISSWKTSNKLDERRVRPHQGLTRAEIKPCLITWTRASRAWCPRCNPSSAAAQTGRPTGCSGKPGTPQELVNRLEGNRHRPQLQRLYGAKPRRRSKNCSRLSEPH